MPLSYKYAQRKVVLPPLGTVDFTASLTPGISPEQVHHMVYFGINSSEQIEKLTVLANLVLPKFELSYQLLGGNVETLKEGDVVRFPSCRPKHKESMNLILKNTGTSLFFYTTTINMLELFPSTGNLAPGETRNLILSHCSYQKG